MTWDLAHDVILRRTQPLSRMAKSDPALSDVYAYWASHRARGLLPRRRTIDMLQLDPALGRIDLLEVAGRHPREYRFRLHGSLVWLARFGGSTHAQVDDDAPSLPQTLTDDCCTVAWFGTPLYQDIVERRALTDYGCSRLFLPLSDDGRTVSMLAICTTDAMASSALRLAAGCSPASATASRSRKGAAC